MRLALAMADYSREVLLSWPIRRLKADLSARGVSSEACTEKAELVELLLSAAREPPKPPPVARKVPTREPVPDVSDMSAEAVEVRRVLACAPGQHYATLSVPASADAEALKRAYRVLALRLHPDKCAVLGADEAFKRVGRAYAALRDPQQRRAYDLVGGDGAAGASNNPISSTGRPQSAAHSFGDTDAAELFRAFFGTGGGGGGGAWSPSAVEPTDLSASALVERGLSLGQRLVKTFIANPWTLVTLLSALASVVSIAESLVTILGRWLVVALPAAAAGLFVCPPHQRRSLAMVAAVVLCSPFML